MRIEIKRAESQDNRMEKTSFSKNIFVNQPPILRYTSSGRVIMDKIIAFLLTVKYDREPWKVKHQLSDIVLLIFFARLSGAEYTKTPMNTVIALFIGVFVYSVCRLPHDRIGRG